MEQTPQRIIRPQPGKQMMFLSSAADIVIYGGAAGGGKTFGELLEPVRHVNNPGFGGVIFRQQSTQIRTEGGLWDESEEIYPFAGARPKQTTLEWIFPSGAKMTFAHMEYDKDRLAYQGAQITYMAFDEITHFSKKIFFYMLSRNRSLCGVRPYIRATCNPDPDSFIAEMIEWWIDHDTGYPIEERGGVVRYFLHINDELRWAATEAELKEKYGSDSLPKSFTFIPANIYDNPILLKKDPGYLANLNALGHVEREQLLKNNWKIRPAAGLYFQRRWVEVVDAAPVCEKTVRYWDRAATEKTADNDPDWTVGVKMGMDKAGYVYILNVVRFQGSPKKVVDAIKNTASQDGKGVIIGLEQEPGASGKSEVQSLIRTLAGFNASASLSQKDKVTRFSPLSAQCEAGNVKVLKAPWNDAFITECENFPEATHDDQPDSAAGGYDMLVEPQKITAGASIRRVSG